MKPQNYYLSVLFLLLTTTLINSQIISYQGFRNPITVLVNGNGTFALGGTNTMGDNWGFSATTTNGQVSIENNPSRISSNSLQLINYWDNVSTIEFQPITFSAANNNFFELYYGSDGNSDNNENLVLEYETKSGASAWTATNTVVLVTSNNSNSDTVNLATSSKYLLSLGSTVTDFRFRIKVAHTEASGGNEIFYLDDIKLYKPAPEIQVTSFGEIFSGSTATSSQNNTDFGEYDINSGQKTKTFTIKNIGERDLVLGNQGVSFQGASNNFSIISGNANGQIITPNSSYNFTIAFDPNAIGDFATTVEIKSNDNDENPFTFVIKGKGVLTYPDTDSDNFSNNIDIDDDNDGLSDSLEQLTCKKIANSNNVSTIFLNETFGTGTSRVRINGTTPGVFTSYFWEDGTNAQSIDEMNTNPDLNDGKYTVGYSITDNLPPLSNCNDCVDIASWADRSWSNIQDHTFNDTNGRMAIFNASFSPGVFYELEVSGLISNVPLDFNFWVANIDNKDSNFSNCNDCRIKPNITVNFLSTDRSTILHTINTGDITRCNGTGNAANNSCNTSIWKNFGTSVIMPQSQFIIQLINNNTGGLGNDLAIDDIVISQSLCDSDGDGVSDILDLDADNDGLPNRYESGSTVIAPDTNNDATTWEGGTNYGDNNNNGMRDSLENFIPIDSDEDGIANYIDLDSDNDTVFDVYEIDNKGDSDVNNNGNGDGTDEKTAPTNDAFDGDGILGINDTNDDDNDANDHGSSYTNPIDTDNDGIPNYLDTKSNGIINDINTTLFSSLDTNNDGKVDGNIDLDEDGIIDNFDTDETKYGSPVDIDQKVSLYFDGRNDYVEDDGTSLASQTSGTLMAWIKIDSGTLPSGNIYVLGHENFSLFVDASRKLVGKINNITTQYPTVLPQNIWVHVTAVYSGNAITLYVNGANPQTLSIASSSIATFGSNLIRIGANPGNTLSNFFKGEIDEVRIFTSALSQTDILKVTYQELNSSDFTSGEVIPSITPTSYSNATTQKYFRMDRIKNDILDNLKTTPVDINVGAKMYNIKHYYTQTAPLPYETIADGTWNSNGVWKNQNVQDINSIGNLTKASIVKIKHNINTNATSNANFLNAGLIIDAGKTLTITGDRSVENNWFLNLNGKIDLQNDSQLIQTINSTLNPTSTGSIERDQQGTQNSFTYNYFASPVGSQNNTTNNNDYTIASVLRDASNPNSLQNLDFGNSFFYADGVVTSPKKLSSYWMWKFVNSGETYANWIQIRENGNLKVGEGFTMKGNSNTSSISTNQNYTFVGKPNNGNISLNITANNIYLVGNPYPSALDANKFIQDNIGLTGTLLFWEHWGGNTHFLSGYQGGYGTYNLMMATPGTSNSLVSNIGSGTKIPKRYIPVAQGFFVKANNANTSINFNNSQRFFQREDNVNSIFFKNSGQNSTASLDNDTRRKVRIGIVSNSGYTKQIGVGEDANTTFNVDFGYDGEESDLSSYDIVNWKIDNKNYVIQGIPQLNNAELPLITQSATNQQFTFRIDGLENIDDSLPIYIKDKLNGSYHNLRTSNYVTQIESGKNDQRLEIVFKEPAVLNTTEFLNEKINVYSFNQTINIDNPKNIELSKLELFDTNGRLIATQKMDSTNRSFSWKLDVSQAVYIIKVSTSKGEFNKKVILN